MLAPMKVKMGMMLCSTFSCRVKRRFRRRQGLRKPQYPHYVSVRISLVDAAALSQTSAVLYPSKLKDEEENKR